MRFLIIATFKSNKLTSEVQDWLSSVVPTAASCGAKVTVAPSFPHLPLVPATLSRAAQDVSPFPPGSYTGAVNATQLADLQVEYCLVGHSERRRYFHETHQEIANKASELVASNITPVLCLSQEDITPQLAALDNELKQQIIYVYEPPADIGGTETAPLEDIDKTCQHLRQLVGSAPVLYGGSVNAGNLTGLINLGLDGVLVSTASLDSKNFISVLNTFSSHGS